MVAENQNPDIDQNINLLVNEIQLLLAEKRTALSLMRTRIAIFALPFSVLSVLIAPSKRTTVVNVMHLLIPVLGICAGLVILAIYLIVQAMNKLRALVH